MHKRTMVGVVLVSVVFMAQARLVVAQDERLQKIEQRLTALEEREAPNINQFGVFETYIPVSFSILGIGLFCGLWRELRSRLLALVRGRARLYRLHIDRRLGCTREG